MAASREWRTEGTPTTDEPLRICLNIRNALAHDVGRLQECILGATQHHAAKLRNCGRSSARMLFAESLIFEMQIAEIR